MLLSTALSGMHVPGECHVFPEELYIAEHDKCVFSSTCFTAAMPTSQAKIIPLQTCPLSVALLHVSKIMV